MYTLPDNATLAKYMYLLFRVIITARARTYDSDPALAQLLDAVHNLPDLLLRWPDMNESFVAADLEGFERDHPGFRGAFSTILKDGAPPRWQLKWTVGR